ncbi:MAG TPA: HAMP domain-containing sensor histidine kinase [Kineosporiaceae bacterium]|nr:HAMP domain-containing sensor histidine kinase [Kineosporiaceae bacterium]
MTSATATRTPWARARRAWGGVPLRTRLVAILLAALIAALALTGYAVQAVLKGYLVGQIDDQLSGYYRLAAEQPRSVNGLIRAGSTGPTTFATYVYFPGHPELTLASAPRPDVEPPAFPAVDFQRGQQLEGEPFTVAGTNGGYDWRAVVIPATYAIPSGPPYTGTVTLALPLQGVDLAVSQLRVLTLSIGGIVIVVCALLGWLAIRRSFAPLVQVEETAAAIAAGDLSRRMPPRPRTTEVGRLTASLNGMLAQIESAFRARAASEERTRRFAADASHELRTPLAAIRGFAELYRQGAVPPQDVGRTMRRIEDEATRMGALVDDLLLLARLDERRPARAEPVDLAVLAGDAVHDARGLDPQRRVRLVGLGDASGPVPAVAVGDEGGLRQVVTNLVANAIRHTPAGSPVEVAVGMTTVPGQEGWYAVLEVRDHGRGLAPEEAQRVFERFYRVDSSRRRGTGGGSGLGLSIVAAVTAAHGGTVDVRPTPGGGATFRVALPAAPVPAPAA